MAHAFRKITQGSFTVSSQSKKLEIVICESQHNNTETARTIQTNGRDVAAW